MAGGAGVEAPANKEVGKKKKIRRRVKKRPKVEPTEEEGTVMGKEEEEEGGVEGINQGYINPEIEEVRAGGAKDGLSERQLERRTAGVSTTAAYQTIGSCRFAPSAARSSHMPPTNIISPRMSPPTRRSASCRAEPNYSQGGIRGLLP